MIGRMLHHPATAWLILLTSLALTMVAWKISNDAVSKRAAERFAFQTADVTMAIQKRMVEYETVLRSGIALFNASEDVGRAEWATFVETLAVSRYYPGIQGIGFSKVIPSDRIPAHEARMRSQGFPNYSLHPKGPRSLHTAIVYLEPLDFRNRRAIGYDMFSEPVRRQAMERARDTGNAALSGMVKLVQETDTDIQNGFLLYLPLYRKGAPLATVDQRRQALQGFIYSPFRVKDLMHGILGTGQGGISFELFDGPEISPQTLLYDYDDEETASSLDPHGKPEFSSVSQIPVAGHIWTVYLYSRPGYLSAGDVSQPLVVAFGGITIDILLFVIIASIARQKARAQHLADGMTRDLRQSNADLEQFTHILAHHMQEPIRLQHVYCQRLAQLGSERLDTEARHALDFIMQGALRQRALLRDVRLYLSVHRKPPPAEPCDTGAALDVALKFLREPIARSGAVIRRDDLPGGLIDADLLADVFTVLISNAIQHGRGDAAPVIHVAARRHKERVTVSVCDNGPGIPAQFRERVFQVFERLGPRSESAGTGIGLALARKIIESSGGSIWIEDSPTGGACLAFSLPGE